MGLYEDMSALSKGQVSLTQFIAGEMLESEYAAFEVRSWWADGRHSESVSQLLFGEIEPHVHDDGTISGGMDYVWTMFNFTTGQITTTRCWGGEPSFLIIRDET